MKKVILYTLAVALLAVGTCTAASIGARLIVEGYAAAKERVARKFAIYYPVTVEKPVYVDPDIEEIVADEAETSGVNKDLIHAVMQVESANRTNATKFEPRSFANDKEGLGVFDRVMKNSSHGAMQVMGFNAKRCGLTWQDLYKPRQGIRCGITILRDCLERAKAKRTSDKITEALGCYNGDRVVYPQKVKAALIDRLIGQGKVKLAMNFK